MAYFADTYTQIKNRFLDFLKGERSNDGGNVADVTLDYANRAQQSLWQRREWCYLVKEQSLTLSGLTANLPTDFGRVVLVGHDSDGDGKPEYFYFANGGRQNGYKIRDAFTKASGHVFTMTFFIAPSSTPVLYYIKKLDDFTGEGTEYSYFPAELMLMKMEELYLIDAGLVGNDLAAVQTAFKREVRDYEQAHQYTNAEMMMRQLDAYGREINNDGYALDGNYEARKSLNSPSYDEDSL